MTGSRHLLEVDGFRVLVDCGLYQERQFAGRNWEPFPVPPKSINALLLTHAHLDHCGYLPRLVKNGFRGDIFCTAATADIADIVLRDSATIQEEDASAKRKRHAREGRKGHYPEEPLYTVEDVEKTSKLFSPVEYEKPVRIARGIEASFHEAGHILGSTMIKVRAAVNGRMRTVVFSGDVGRWGKPILRDPTVFDEADYVVVESTYGDKVHEDKCCLGDRFAEVINSTCKAGGNVVIPAFAIERAQELLYHLNLLQMAGKIPVIPVFMDSPMAINVTQVFENHPELFDSEMNELIRKRQSPFDLPNVTTAKTRDESKQINDLKQPAIIMAGSGMCTGGRIKHHLMHNIMRPESTILFVGYQASGTLGGQIVGGAKEARIFGVNYPVRARVERIEGFSAHADRNELMKWLSGLERPPKHLFVAHGEPETAQAFADFVKAEKNWEVSVPDYRDTAAIN